MIRHAGLAAALPIAPLPVAVIEASFGALLVAAIGFAPLAKTLTAPA